MDYRLVVVRGRSAPATIPLGDGVTTAGRQEDCQLRIASSQVSRRHCEIFEKKGLLLVKDLGSSNGTFVNGKKIEGQRVVEHGDELTIGPIKFRVEKMTADAKTKPADTAVGPAANAGVAIDLDETPMASVSPKPTDPSSKTEESAKPTIDSTKTAEVGEDDVVDFLLDLEVDDQDRS